MLHSAIDRVSGRLGAKMSNLRLTRGILALGCADTVLCELSSASASTGVLVVGHLDPELGAHFGNFLSLF